MLSGLARARVSLPSETVFRRFEDIATRRPIRDFSKLINSITVLFCLQKKRNPTLIL